MLPERPLLRGRICQPAALAAIALGRFVPWGAYGRLCGMVAGMQTQRSELVKKLIWHPAARLSRSFALPKPQRLRLPREGEAPAEPRGMQDGSIFYRLIARPGPQPKVVLDCEGGVVASVGGDSGWPRRL
jgi:hypothetical protein